MHLKYKKKYLLADYPKLIEFCLDYFIGTRFFRVILFSFF